MPLLANTVKCVELTFPLSVWKSFNDLHQLNAKDNDGSKLENLLQERYSCLTNNKPCTLDIKSSVSECSEIEVTFIIDFLDGGRDKLNRGKLKCSLSNLSKCETICSSNANVTSLSDNAQKEIPATSDEVTPIVPRKRGRPKGSCKLSVPEPVVNDNSLTTKSSEPSSELVKNNYRLRGVKLSSKIMKLEKKSFDDVEDENDGTDSDDDDNVSVIAVNINSNNNVYQNPDEHLSEKENIKTISIIDDIKSENCDNSVAEIPNVDSTEKAKKSKRILKMDSENDVSEMQNDEFTIKKSKGKKRRVYQCVICENRTFTTRQEMKIHEKVDHQDLVCTKCDNKVYKHINSLKSHCIWIHGKNSQSRKHLCHHCSSRFKFANSLKQHIEEIHEGIVNLHCKVCGKSFYKLSQLRRHEKIHGDAKSKLKCNICGQGFWHESNRQRHIRLIHMKPKNEKFHCPYCGKGFVHKAGMISHIKLIHMTLFHLQCSVCSLRFSRTKQLKEHMAEVHKDKNFKVLEPRPTRFKYNRTPNDLLPCSKCSSSFCYKAELIEHMHTAHADTFPFVCVVCNQGFMQQHFLNKHRKAAHNVTLTQEEEEELELATAHDTRVDIISEEIVSVQNGENSEDPVSFIDSKNNIRYVVQNDQNMIYGSSDISYITTEDGGVTYLTGDNEGEVAFLETDNVQSEVTYLTSDEGNVTYVTNVEYENLEEVVTSLNPDTIDRGSNQISVESEQHCVGEQVVLQLEDGENTVSYVIHQSKDGKTQEIAAEDIAEILMAAKHAGTLSTEQCDTVLSNLTEDNS